METAFRWIVDIFQKNKVTFQLSGGLAAKVYGSPRKLRDIDFDIPHSDFKKVIREIKPFVIFGPGRFISEDFDVWLVRLDYNGQ